MLENLSFKILVAECGFESKLSLINLTSKGLVYLKGEVNGTNVSMLVDTGATNSFLTPMCAARLKVEVVDTALPVKINFVQGSCQAGQVAEDVSVVARW